MQAPGLALLFSPCYLLFLSKYIGFRTKRKRLPPGTFRKNTVHTVRGNRSLSIFRLDPSGQGAHRLLRRGVRAGHDHVHLRQKRLQIFRFRLGNLGNKPFHRYSQTTIRFHHTSPLPKNQTDILRHILTISQATNPSSRWRPRQPNAVTPVSTDRSPPRRIPHRGRHRTRTAGHGRAPFP